MSLKYVNPDDEAPKQHEPPHPENERVVRAAPGLPYFSLIFIASLVAVFATQYIDGLESSAHLAETNNILIRHGDYWRLITGATMHGFPLHLFLNCMAFYNLGNAIEFLSNRYHLAIVFLFATVGGSLFSLLVAPDDSFVGASGGIVGLLGYLTVYGYKRRKLLPPSFLRTMLINIGILALIGTAGYQYIGNSAHFGGLVFGAAYGAMQIPSNLHEDPRKTDTLTTALGWACLATFLGFAVLTILLLTKKIAL